MKYQNIAVAWIKKDKNGKSFLSVKVEKDLKAGDNFNLFSNDKGDNPARPDYRAYEKIEEEVEAEVEEVDPDSIPF